MEVRNTTIDGLFEIFPTVLRDSRGWFLESYNKDKFQDLDLDFNFVQDNLSFSKAGVLRGIHFQTAPFEQGKLVKVVQGEVLDVAVDLRPASPTFGSYEKVVLTAKEQNMFFIPEGFGHAFYAITDAYLFYKCTKTYQAEFDSGIAYDDPDLAIDWNIDKLIISEKDKNLKSFQAYKSELGLV